MQISENEQKPNQKKQITFNKNKCVQLIGGTIGIYSTYLVVGLLQEWLIKQPYKNTVNSQQEHFNSPVSLIFFPHLATYLISALYNQLHINKAQRTNIPAKNSLFCAFFVLLGALTFNLAIKWTSYPIVATFKSCNLLSVILVGIFCSRVTDKSLKLSPHKIGIGLVASLGILTFKYFDPEVKQGDDKKLEFLGFFVLFISLLADGFLPDFQAEIKSKYNPKPTEMMTEINKWVSVFCGIYVIWSGEGVETIKFMINHELFGFHLVSLSLLSFVGHLIIYRMIKSFKQHIVPFVIATRKVFTVCVSLVFYGHKSHIGQILGIIIVLGVVVYEFYNQMTTQKKIPVVQEETYVQDQKSSEVSLQLQELNEEVKQDKMFNNPNKK